MVLLTRNIVPYPEGHGFPFEGIQQKERVGDMVLQTQLVGMIHAVSALSEYANDIFSSILTEASSVSSRIASIGDRCAALNQTVTTVEAYHQRTSLDTLNSTPRSEFHAANPEEHQHFTNRSIPANISAQYEKCKPPPNLALLDSFMEDGQKCLKLYTNPEFFLEQWIEEQVRLNEEAKQKRRERREARLKRKAEKGQGDASVGPKKVNRIRKVKYDPVTGEKIVTYSDEPAVGTPQQSQSNINYVPTSNQFSTGNTAGFYDAPPPPSLQTVASTSLGMPPPPPMAAQAPPPLYNYAPSPNMPSPAVSSPAGMGMGGMGMGGRVASMSIPSPMMGMQQHEQRQSMMMMQGSTGAPPPPPNAPPPPPPPNAPPPPPNAPPPPPNAPPPPPAGGLAGALANSQLRATPTEAVKPKVVDKRSDLLSSIKEGITLKSVKDAPAVEAPKQQSQADNSVANILARRIAWAPSDDEDDDSDDEDWD